MGTRKALLAVLLLTAAACGGGSAADSTATPPPGQDTTGTTTTTTAGSSGPSQGAIDSIGTCTITITGDVEETATYEMSPNSFNSDHWLSDDQLRDSFDFMAEVYPESSFEERWDAGIPILTLFQLRCADPEDMSSGPGVGVITSDNNKRDDFPMGPGTHPVAGFTIFEVHGPAGTVQADLTMGDVISFRPHPDSGNLVIERRDRSRLVGHITFDASENFTADGREVSVRMEFDIRCGGAHLGCD